MQVCWWKSPDLFLERLEIVFCNFIYSLCVRADVEEITMSLISLPVRRLKNSIWNLISWFPIVWRDRDWDYRYFLTLIHFKLKKMEKCIRKGCYRGCENDADKIQICVVCLERLIKDDYCAEEWYELSKKWGEMQFIPCDDNSECSTITFENIKTEKDKEEYRTDVKKIVEKENKKIRGDLDLVFGVIKDNILKRWN